MEEQDFAALMSSQLNRQIIRYLLTHQNKKVRVTKMAKDLQVLQNSASRNLNTMRLVGLIGYEDGKRKERYYHILEDRLEMCKEYLKFLDHFFGTGEL